MLLIAEGTIGALLQLIGASTIGILILCVLIAWSNKGNNKAIAKKKHKSMTTNNKRYNKKIA